MSVTQHSLTNLTLVGVGSMNLKSAGITLDETWSPYAQASLVVAPPAWDWTRCDPRAGQRVTFDLVLTKDVDGPNPVTTTRHFDLGLRRRTRDGRTGQLTLFLSSDEALLQDWRWTDGYIVRAGKTQARDSIANALTLIGATLTAGTADTIVDTAATDFPPGISGWDYCQPLALQGDLRLWCDELRVWRLDPASAIIAPTTAQLSAKDTIKQVDDDINRDGDWYDGVVITYTWTDQNAAQRVAYDFAPTDHSAKRTLAISRSSAKPGTGAASATRARLLARGRQSTVRARSQYNLSPGTAVQITDPEGLVLSSAIASISWTLDDTGGGDEMEVRTRDLYTAPPLSWLASPAGRKWTDVAPGQPWSTYTP